MCLYTNASSLSVLYTGGSMSIGADLSLGSMLSGRVLETEKKKNARTTNKHPLLIALTLNYLLFHSSSSFYIPQNTMSSGKRLHNNSKHPGSHLARPSTPATGRWHLVRRLLPRLIASLGLFMGRCTSIFFFRSFARLHRTSY